VLIGTILFLAACTAGKSDSITPGDSPITLVYYDWEDDIPVEILDEFTLRTGIQVDYQSYASSVIAEQALLTDEGSYDVVVIDNDYIPLLAQHNKLHELTYENIPNFRYISINFRDLVYDPGNRFSVPFNWGSTGMILRQGEDMPDIQAWEDLWQYSDTIRIGFRRDLPFDHFAVAKKMLGYSINACDPEILESAYQALLMLSPAVVLVDSDAASAIDEFDSGELDVLIGWSDDVFEARDRNLNITYLLPKEGTFLWGDSYIIPANSRHPKEAEQLINFFLDPVIAGKILQYNRYASANDRIKAYLPAELLFDSTIYPSDAAMQDAEIYLPIPQTCSDQQQAMWDDFINQLNESSGNES
jgi:spermidine/putrescine transport system substrate-binding protein